MSLNSLAEQYVKLVLAIGLHHPHYVDAYYGPSDWQPTTKEPLEAIQQQVTELVDSLKNTTSNESETLRHTFLLKQSESILTFINVISGNAPKFDEESLALYDAISPNKTESEFDNVLLELENLVPGDGHLSERMVAFNAQFEIPKNKLDDVFKAAVARSREITKQFIPLADNENFQLEYVTNQIWSGYNWYKGDNFSLIQMNTDFPIYISRAVDLAAHEGYPGHHVFNSLMEKHLVNEKGWMEYCVYPLFSPMSLLAEGSANYGIEVVFPKPERMVFEKEVLFVLAGLDASQAERYYEVQALMQKLSYADNMVAKRLLDGEISEQHAIELLIKYTLVSKARATQRLGFIKANRAYVLNYNLGQDIVKAYIEKHANMQDKNSVWQVFADLLANPRPASLLV
ncbi:hypothetical protein [Pseudoalteromonas spongiae]|uniref:hypothetical protein n=1 Tax=Pseudoalteromonas spongiae TaxID=298657 RepID=UPI00026CD3B8|nr:hypothetical protein [Pseudoalteromonas spongiae]ATD01077.1 hypothetical protein PSPO_b1172 [Pseudoalteromonas spongiae UST010723-006]